MDKKDKKTESHIPESFDSIQVNFCKNPKCPNFGIPVLENIKGINFDLQAKNPPSGRRDFLHVSGGPYRSHSSARLAHQARRSEDS